MARGRARYRDIQILTLGSSEQPLAYHRRRIAQCGNSAGQEVLSRQP
jgi:hypothetical protein